MSLGRWLGSSQRLLALLCWDALSPRSEYGQPGLWREPSPALLQICLLAVLAGCPMLHCPWSHTAQHRAEISLCCFQPPRPSSVLVFKMF